MPVHRLSHPIRQRPRCRVPQIRHHRRATRFQRRHQQFVLAIEIRRAGQNPIRLQSCQRIAQQPVPHDRLVPIILMPDENEIEWRQLTHPVRRRRVAAAELDFPLRQCPARRCLRDRIRPQIDAQIKSDPRRSQSRRQRPRLIRAPAREIQNRQPPERKKVRRLQSITQQRRQPGDIAIGSGISKGSALNHARSFQSQPPRFKKRRSVDILSTVSVRHPVGRDPFVGQNVRHK